MKVDAPTAALAQTLFFFWDVFFCFLLLGFFIILASYCGYLAQMHYHYQNSHNIPRR